MILLNTQKVARYHRNAWHHITEISTALANGDIEFLAKNIHDNITWEIVGYPLVTGKENYFKAIKGHKLWKVKELTVDTIITHGPDASVSGQVTAADNSTFAFCDIYRFKGAGGTTINSIKTFLVLQRVIFNSEKCGSND